jgi:hypothetical protein
MAHMTAAIVVIRETENGICDYMAETREQQNARWRAEMAPKGRRGEISTSAEMNRLLWDALYKDRFVEQPALAVGGPHCLFDAPKKPTLAPAPPKQAAPAARPKRGGWRFEAAK